MYNKQTHNSKRKRRDAERKKDRDMGIKRGMQLVPVGHKEGEKNPTFFPFAIRRPLAKIIYVTNVL